jgi:hypothetical protein
MTDINPIGIDRLTKDLRDSARNLTTNEARYLVDYYYKLQDDRVRSAAQVRSSEEDESVGWIHYVFGHLHELESRIKSALGIYASGQPLGEWAQSITGIGPVISAGLLAHIDIVKTPHPGALWRLAGLDPTLEWVGREKAKALVNETVGKSKTITEEALATICARTFRHPQSLKALALTPKPDGEKPKKLTKENLTRALARRPWNARLKVLAWKIGESFVKQRNRKGGEMYGGYYVERRALEDANNAAGKYKDAALVKAKTVGKATEAYKHYSKGTFPPGHIYARSKRWVVKLFLSHYHHVGYEILHGEPPDRPWIITHGGHSDFIPPPNWK